MDAGIFWQETALLTGRQMARAQKSDVEAVITTKADSIKNPLSGQIQVPGAGEVIIDDEKAKGQAVISTGLADCCRMCSCARQRSFHMLQEIPAI